MYAPGVLRNPSWDGTKTLGGRLVGAWWRPHPGGIIIGIRSRRSQRPGYFLKRHGTLFQLEKGPYCISSVPRRLWNPPPSPDSASRPIASSLKYPSAIRPPQAWPPNPSRWSQPACAHRRHLARPQPRSLQAVPSPGRPRAVRSRRGVRAAAIGGPHATETACDSVPPAAGEPCLLIARGTAPAHPPRAG